MQEAGQTVGSDADPPGIASASSGVGNYHAGCSLPRRDSIDARIADEVRSGTATFGRNGIIASPSDVGGWPELKSEPAPADTDNDGMPDAWEAKFGLEPNDPSDSASDQDSDGHTNIEEYLNDTDPTVFVDYTKPENNICMPGATQ